MATHASAIPENLYTYSDQCTRGARELQDWVRGVLTPAINTYENGGGTCLVPIDGEVNAAAAAASGTDAEVRRIGRAFQEAGSQGPLPGVGRSPDDLPYRPAEAVYRMSDSALAGAVAHQDQLAAGAALADKMTRKGDPDNIKWITQQLDLHGADGFFAAGFFNSLSANQIAELLGRRGDCVLTSNDQALANALATGAVNKQTAHNIVTALSWVQGTDNSVEHWHIAESQQLSALAAIAGDRTAARNFTDLISDADLHRLINLSAYSNDGKVFTQVFNVLSQSALTRANDTPGMTAFMHRVAHAMRGVDLTYVPGSEAILLQFVSLGIAGSIPDPGPGMGHKELTRWIENQSNVADSILSEYLYLIMKSNAARDSIDNTVKSITEGSVLNILPWGAAVHTGSEAIDNLLIGGLQSGAGLLTDDAFAGALNKNTPGDGDIDVRKFAAHAGNGPARIALWTQLAKHGYLVDSNNVPVNLSSGDTKSLILKMSSYPHNYSIRNGDNDLKAVDKIFDFTGGDSLSYRTIDGDYVPKV